MRQPPPHHHIHTHTRLAAALSSLALIAGVILFNGCVGMTTANQPRGTSEEEEVEREERATKVEDVRLKKDRDVSRKLGATGRQLEAGQSQGPVQRWTWTKSHEAQSVTPYTTSDFLLASSA